MENKTTHPELQETPPIEEVSIETEENIGGATALSLVADTVSLVGSSKESEDIQHVKEIELLRWFFGNFILISDKGVDWIGKGSYSTVFKVEDLESNVNVAVKIYAKDEDSLNSGLDEIRILKLIYEYDPDKAYRHLFVELFRSFDHSGHLCVVYELLGNNLYEFMHRNDMQPYPLEGLSHILHQVCEALTYLHRHDIIHTDIKPENIVFVHSNDEELDYKKTTDANNSLISTNIKLIDFSSSVTSTDHHYEEITTMNYRAPEVFLRSPWGKPCDMWSLGCTAFELYTGRNVFRSRNGPEILALMEKILNQPLPKEFGILGSLQRKIRDAADSPKVKAAKLLNEFKHSNDKKTDALFDLINEMLQMNQFTRIKAEDTLQHVFFTI